MAAGSVTGSLPYLSVAFLLGGMYLLRVSAPGLARTRDALGASIAVGVGRVYVAVGALLAIMSVVIG